MNKYAGLKGINVIKSPMCASPQEQFQDRTPYTIMFGPDKCGEDYKLHFIFRHQNPLNKDFEEKHAKRPDVDLKKFYTDKKTHLYTLGTEAAGNASLKKKRRVFYPFSS